MCSQNLNNFPCAWTAPSWSMLNNCQLCWTKGAGHLRLLMNKRAYHVSLKTDLLSHFQLKAAQKKTHWSTKAAKVFVRWLQAVPLPVFMKAAQHQEWEQRNATKVNVHFLSCSPQLCFYDCFFFFSLNARSSSLSQPLPFVAAVWTELGYYGKWATDVFTLLFVD